MSNALIDLNDLGIAKRSEDQERALSELSKSSDYLPALRVYGSAATIVKQGKFPQGHFGLYFSADKILDLGPQTDVLVIDYRPRASIMLSEEAPISFFNPESETFIAVKEKGQQKVQGYMYGLEYLLWIPSVKHFGCFFMGNPTLRRESENVKSSVGGAVTLKIKFIPSKQYGGWHGAEALACDTPFDIPSKEEIMEVHSTKFANPVDSQVKMAEADQSGRVR
jgi:hypothetical protein